MQAIVVKYLGPTQARGSRFKASCLAGNVTLPIDNAMSLEANAALAAAALCNKLGRGRPYYGDLIEGGLMDGSRVFVMTGGSTAAYDIETGTRREDRT